MNHNKILYLQTQQLKHLYLKNKIEKMTHLNIIENMLTILLLTMYCYYKMITVTKMNLQNAEQTMQYSNKTFNTNDSYLLCE